MIDPVHKIRRFITEFSLHTDELLAEYDLSSFDLNQFQREFGETNPQNPMFDCYDIKQNNIRFLEGYLSNQPDWDFGKKAYFLEAESI